MPHGNQLGVAFVALSPSQEVGFKDLALSLSAKRLAKARYSVRLSAAPLAVLSRQCSVIRVISLAIGITED